MKIAVPTIGGLIDEYFNTCEVFTIFTVNDEKKIVERELLYTPEGCDCKNNIPLILQQKGVICVLAYQFPEHKEEVCAQYGIKGFPGYSGDVNEAVRKFINEEIILK